MSVQSLIIRASFLPCKSYGAVQLQSAFVFNSFPNPKLPFLVFAQLISVMAHDFNQAILQGSAVPTGVVIHPIVMVMIDDAADFSGHVFEGYDVPVVTSVPGLNGDGEY
jgi:hypothetical protein